MKATLLKILLSAALCVAATAVHANDTDPREEAYATYKHINPETSLKAGDLSDAYVNVCAALSESLTSVDAALNKINSGASIEEINAAVNKATEACALFEETQSKAAEGNLTTEEQAVITGLQDALGAYNDALIDALMKLKDPHSKQST